MKTLLFLLLCWGLSLGQVAAQSRPAGPWRVVYRLVRVRKDELREDDAYYDLRNPGNFQLPSETETADVLAVVKLEAAERKISSDSIGLAYDDWGTLKKHSDTTTVLRTKRITSKVAWNINPDSIRLFLNCENPLTALPGRAAIRFAATGATLRFDAKQHLFWLAPTAPVVVLRAYRGQRLVFRHEFRAVEPPPPVVDCYVGGAKADDARPEDVGKHYSLTMKAIPNMDFAAFMPADARYRVAKYRVTLVRAGEVGPTLLIDGPQGNIQALNFTDELGGELQADILLVQRQNFRGQVFESVKPLRSQFSIPSEKP
ncbi:MAG: hypothetical protein ACRYFX_22595 [Janthinobacterium lividum]